MATTAESSAAALQRYSAFVEEVLRPQLQETLARRDALAREVSEYQELQELIRELMAGESSTSSGGKGAKRPLIRRKSGSSAVHTLVDVGERFQVRAKIPDASLITVDVGLNFHVEMTLPEAQRFVERHLQHLTEKRNAWQQKAREVSEHVNLVIESIQQLAALQ